MVYSIFILTVGVYLFLISFSNIIYLSIVSKQNCFYDSPKIDGLVPKVSVLIPARNEVSRIRPLLDSLVQQNYSNFEICILNDGSTDGTAEILDEYREKYSNIKIFNGSPLALGWKGKPHALQQLINQTTGDYVICLDADLEVKQDFISWTISRMTALNADCLSGWPKHHFTILENILCPSMYTMTSFLIPLWLIPLLKNKYFSFAIQFAAYKREPLMKIGGYAAVKNVMNEDLGMARAMKAAGFKSYFIDAKKKIQGTMYESFSAAVVGIERSIANVFEGKLYPVLILSTFILLSMVLPSFYVILSIVFQFDGWIIGSVGIVFFLAAWILTMIDRRLNVVSWFLFPIVYSAIIFLGWRSYFHSKNGKGYIWKGRKVV